MDTGDGDQGRNVKYINQKTVGPKAFHSSFDDD